jgi:hypothetical protein
MYPIALSSRITGFCTFAALSPATIGGAFILAAWQESA